MNWALIVNLLTEEYKLFSLIVCFFLLLFFLFFFFAVFLFLFFFLVALLVIVFVENLTLVKLSFNLDSCQPASS